MTALLTSRRCSKPQRQYVPLSTATTSLAGLTDRRYAAPLAYARAGAGRAA